jgi:hypothetical protein
MTGEPMSRLNTWFRIGLGAVALGLSAAAPAQACSCMRGGDEQIEKVLRETLDGPGSFMAEAVATGSSGGSQKTTTFKIVDSWAGSPGKSARVRHGTSSAACGVTFTLGQKVMLLSSGGATNLCSQLVASRSSAWGKARVRALTN